MQKILTKEEREKKTKIKQLLIGSVLILIMILATAGYSLTSSNNDVNSGKIVTYKGVDFVLADDSYWRFNKDGIDFMTRYNPTELNNTKISLIGLSLQNYQGKVLYTAGEPDDAELMRNIYQLMQKQYIQRYSRACISENCTENAPIKNCSADNVIIIKEAGPNQAESIYNDENCVYISASYANQTKYIDAFLFKILRIE